MEVTKRTYQKHKTEKKITVKHYVNNSQILDTKGLGDEKINIYALYVLVTYNRRNTKFRSQLPSAIEESIPEIGFCCDDLDNTNNTDDYLNAFKVKHWAVINGKAFVRDVNFITWLVKCGVEVNGSDFSITDLSELYHNKAFELSFFVEWALREELRKALVEILPYKFNIPKDKLLFGINVEEVLLEKHKVYDDVSALQNLEFYSIEYPKLNDLRKKYSSQIWFLGIYLQKMLDNSFNSSLYTYVNLVGEGNLESFVPTVFDFSTNIFQESFINIFKDEVDIENMVADINKLYVKYIDEFKLTFFKKHK